MYIQQPSPNLTCTPGPGAEGRLELVCEVRRVYGAEQAFALVWYRVVVGESEPVMLSRTSCSGCTWSVQSINNSQVLSTLSMALPLERDLSQLFCQIQLDDGTLLQRSQALLLPTPSGLAPCDPASLVDMTPTCVGIGDNLPQAAIAQDQGLSMGTASATSTSPTPEVLPVGLYAVVAVIIMFVVIIISLTIIIVLLYRRKCGHTEISGE